jgi:hypothetical protein
LEAQDGFDISKKIFILMMALKGQCPPMLRTAKQVESKKDDESMCDHELFRKFREGKQHLVIILVMHMKS